MSTPVKRKPKDKRVHGRNILWGVFVANSLILMLLGIFFDKEIAEEVLIALGISAFLILAILSLTSRRYYNWTIILLILFFGVGFSFKRYRFPGASLIIAVSAMLMFLHLIVFSVRSFFVLKHNSFLKWLGFVSGFTLAVFMLLLLFWLMHWYVGLDKMILNYTVNVFLIIILLTLIFKLPGMNFSTWLPLDMKIFYRQILVPLLVIFSFSILYNVFPDVYARFFGGDLTANPWHIKEIELFDLEGIDRASIW